METNEEKTIGEDASQMTPEQLQSDLDTIKHVLTETDNSRNIHQILIAAGNFICGFVLLIAVPFFLLAVGIVGVATPTTDAGQANPTLIVGAAAIVAIVVICLLSLPFLFAGWGVLKGKSWGNVMAVIAGILNLSNVPLGTALAIYTIWAVTQGKLPSRRNG